MERTDVEQKLADWTGGDRHVSEELAHFLERAGAAYSAYKIGTLDEKRELVTNLEPHPERKTSRDYAGFPALGGRNALPKHRWWPETGHTSNLASAALPASFLDGRPSVGEFQRLNLGGYPAWRTGVFAVAGFLGSVVSIVR